MKVIGPYDNIMGMVDRDIVSGTPEGLFLPDKEVTRAEFAKMVAVGVRGTKQRTAWPNFSDVSSGDWCYEYVAAL